METFNDIIQDMRYASRLYLQEGDEGLEKFEILDYYADKLDAAYKRDMQAMTDAGEIDMKTAMDEVTRLREENERLKAALKPVLDIVMDRATSDLSMELAITESKRIYNEGGAK